jgi:hypothetical protein
VLLALATLGSERLFNRLEEIELPDFPAAIHEPLRQFQNL